MLPKLASNFEESDFSHAPGCFFCLEDQVDYSLPKVAAKRPCSVDTIAQAYGVGKLGRGHNRFVYGLKAQST